MQLLNNKTHYGGLPQMALAGLHAAAALLHHWVLGVRTLVRMLPRKSARRTWRAGLGAQDLADAK